MIYIFETFLWINLVATVAFMVHWLCGLVKLLISKRL